VRPLRVVLVANRFWPLVGGREKNLAQLSAELAVRQHQVTVWTACWQKNWPRQVVYRGVRVVREADAPGNRWSTIRYLRQLGRWLRSQRDAVDVVCISGLREEAYTAVQSLAGHTPLVLRADPAAPLRAADDANSGAKDRCSWRLHRRCRQADAVVAPFATVARQLLAEGFSPQQVCHIPPGVHIPSPRTAETRRAARRTLAEAALSLQLADDSPLAVYLGRLAPQAALGQLVSAWASVAREIPDARLWLVGYGAAQRALEDQIERQGLAGRVILGGTFDQVDDILAAADWLVQPIAKPGLGLAILEAMAAGLPVVASDTPEHRELLGDGDCGVLVPPADVDAMAAAMLRLAADHALCCRLGTMGRQRAMACFSLQRQTESYLMLFYRLIGLREK